jgi:tetratricopeptide (TPR) repeat protein
MGIEAVEMRKNSLGENHPDTILSLTSLSRIYLEQGRLKEAIELQKSAVAGTNLALGGEYPDNVPDMHQIAASLQATRHLAAIYGIQGRYAEAEKLELEVLGKRKKLLGEKHPDTLLTMRDLAVTYGCQGYLDEAEAFHEHVLDVRKRILGEDHPETLISMCDLALTYCQQDPLKNAAKAERLGFYVVAARKRILGEEHHNTLQAMQDLAMTYELQCRYNEADDLRKQVVEETKRSHEKRPATFRAMSDEIITYKQQSLEQVARTLEGARPGIIGTNSVVEVTRTEEMTTPNHLPNLSPSVSISSSKSEHLEQHHQKNDRKPGTSWRRRLLRWEGRRGKE